jgi:hypothetical protein
MNDRLIDLDELVLRCKDKVTQEYIKEAVACYKAGAFRSCIISTWNAVAFDYLYKLRQLELTGDGQAKDELQNFQAYSLSKNYKKLWEFETNIPKNAQEKYEFISLIEREDLERLNDDRSRCAHPSILSIEEPFQAPPELARYHLRNAVMHLLQYPPVHGRVAIDRIWRTIEYAGFPEDTEEAINVLKNSYLGRARKSLIKDVVIGLTKNLLLEEYPIQERRRKYAALEAVSNLHFDQFQEAIATKLSTIIESVVDEEWYKVFNYLRRIQAWNILNEGQRIKAKIFIQNIDELKEGQNAFMLLNALESNDEIQTIALEQVRKFRNQDLTPLMELIQAYKKKIKTNIVIEKIIQPYKNYAIQGFIDSEKFSDAESYGNKLILVANWLNTEEIRSILNAFHKNDQIWSANKKVPEVMTNLFQETINIANSGMNDWLLVRERIENRPVYADLLRLIDTSFPDLVSNLDTNKGGNGSYARESDE